MVERWNFAEFSGRTRTWHQKLIHLYVWILIDTRGFEQLKKNLELKLIFFLQILSSLSKNSVGTFLQKNFNLFK